MPTPNGYGGFLPEVFFSSVTGSNMVMGSNYGQYPLEMDDSFMDKLLGRMMEHTRLVIIPCKYCGSHNAFSNPCCIKCGAPMGSDIQVSYV